MGDFDIEMLRDCGFVRFFILQHHHQIKVCWTTSDPASSEDRLYSRALSNELHDVWVYIVTVA